MLVNPFAGVKTAALVIAGVATFGAGFAAAELYENYAPWGIGARLTRLTNSLPRKLATARAEGYEVQKKADEIVLEKWRGRLTQCESDARTTSETVAEGLDRAIHRSATSRDAAYRLGLASCRAESRDDKKTGTTDGTSSPAGGVRDDEELRSILAGAAYAPGAR